MTGSYNTADGYGVLYGNTTGGYNTAGGFKREKQPCWERCHNLKRKIMKARTTSSMLTALVLTLAWLALAPAARAVTPASDGGYPNFNTAEGDDALFSLTNGVDNTAIGNQALFSNTNGYFNTAIGADNAMTGNDDSNHVRAIRAADRAACPGIAEPLRHPGIGTRFRDGDRPQNIPRR